MHELAGSVLRLRELVAVLVQRATSGDDPPGFGRVVITTTWVVFTGDLKTREWRFDKLDGVDGDTARAAVRIHVSNRQNVSGLLLGDRGPEFSRHLGLALDIAEHGSAAVSEAWDAKVAEHLGQRPSRSLS